MGEWGWVAYPRGVGNARTDEVIDWNVAVAAGTRWAPAGPSATSEQAAHIVADIRSAARRAIDPVREVTGLIAPDHSHHAVVVARPEWLRANVDQVRIATAPLTRILQEKNTSALTRKIGSRTTAVQLGAVLALLSPKVLGQYEALTTEPGKPGRLLLVAPNIVAAERQLDVAPSDFRLWVCLHEETHRVQFGAVPWLSAYFTEQVHDYLGATETDTWSTLRRLTAEVRTRRESQLGFVDLFHTPRQRDILDRLTALMSLLEGHADVVMDEVGPQVVPSVSRIRKRFDRRRTQHGFVDGLIGRVLGLEAKLRQYTEGAAFVRTVIEQVGMSGFNEVWTSPAALPSSAEITDPRSWARRVLG
jgi:coenzyme F420 biosynthesis associated uncharacterized protein